MRINLIITVIMFALAMKVSVGQQDESGIVLTLEDQLILAADAGDTAKVRQLVKMGADVDAVTSEGVTSLMYATQNQNLTMMDLLIRCGADPDKKPWNGFTALITAIRNSQPDIAEFLVRSGASVDIPDNDQMTPLMYAIVSDSFYMADMLLYYGAPVESRRKDGMDALMISSWIGNYSITEALILAGADINAADNKGRTPLHFASMAGNLDIMQLLIGEGALIEARTRSEVTPLTMSVAKGNFEATRLLISSGAQVNSQIGNALNPLTLARENGYDSLATMLRNNGAKVLVWPWFDKFTVGGQVTFNGDDIFTGLRIGMSDRKYNLWTSMVYDMRPKTARVLEASKGNNYFQYWERRHLVSVSMDKAFWLWNGKNEFKTGFAAGFEESMTFGSYQGSALSPDIRWLFSPRAGVVLQWGQFRVRMNYAFRNLQLLEVDRNWLSLSAEFLLNRKSEFVNLFSVAGL